MLTDIQKKYLSKPCPHCETGKLREVDGNTDEETGTQENYLWCNNCDLSMDGSGVYTC